MSKDQMKTEKCARKVELRIMYNDSSARPEHFEIFPTCRLAVGHKGACQYHVEVNTGKVNVEIVP